MNKKKVDVDLVPLLKPKATAPSPTQKPPRKLKVPVKRRNSKSNSAEKKKMLTAAKAN